MKTRKDIGMVKGVVTIKNPTGLHLTPAGLFCKTAMRFHSHIQVEKQGANGDVTANAKSVLSVLGACIKYGDEICICCEGEDEEQALQAMLELVKAGLVE